MISFKHLGINSWFEEFLFLMLPTPKNCYIFDVSPQVAYERKKATHGGEVDYYEKQRQRYLWLAKRKNIPIVNTNKTTPDDIAQSIFSKIQERLTV